MGRSVGVGHVLPAKPIGCGGVHCEKGLKATFKNCHGWWVRRGGSTEELNGRVQWYSEPGGAARHLVLASWLGIVGADQVPVGVWVSRWAGKGSEMVPTCSFVPGEISQRSLRLQHMLWDC